MDEFLCPQKFSMARAWVSTRRDHRKTDARLTAGKTLATTMMGYNNSQIIPESV